MAVALYSQNFDAYTLDANPPSPWIATPSTGGAVQVVADPEVGAPRGRVVRIFDNDASSRSSLELDHSAAGIVTAFNNACLEFYVRAAQTNKALFVGFKDVDNNYDNVVSLMTTGNFGYHAAAHSESATSLGLSYSANTWYRVLVTMDLGLASNRMTSFHRDASRVGPFNAGTSDATVNWKQLFFRTASGETSEFWIDAVKFGFMYSNVTVGVARKKSGEFAVGALAQIRRQSDHALLGQIRPVAVSGNVAFTLVSTETFSPEPCTVIVLGAAAGDGSSVRPHLQVV